MALMALSAKKVPDSCSNLYFLYGWAAVVSVQFIALNERGFVAQNLTHREKKRDVIKMI